MDHTARPRYLAIVAEVRGRIDRGELAAGDRVPSTRAITREWGVAMATATKVITTLREDGLVQTVPGVGSVVVGSPGPRTHPQTPRVPDKSALIIKESVAIADREGLDAVTLRRVAAHLAMSPGSLYHHVSDQDDLLRRMAASVLDDVQFPQTAPGEWRSGLTAIAWSLWSACTEHPWLAGQLSITRPEPVRGGLVLTERVLTSLDGHGLPLSDMINIHLMLINYVRGSALSLESEVEAAARSGLSRRQWISSRSRRTRELAAEAQVPLFEQVQNLEHEVDLEDVFELGLERLLDGVEVMLGQVRAGHHRPAAEPGSRSPDAGARA